MPYFRKLTQTVRSSRWEEALRTNHHMTFEQASKLHQALLLDIREEQSENSNLKVRNLLSSNNFSWLTALQDGSTKTNKRSTLTLCTTLLGFLLLVASILMLLVVIGLLLVVVDEADDWWTDFVEGASWMGATLRGCFYRSLLLRARVG